MSEWKSVGAWRGGTVAAVAVSPTFQNDGLALAATGAGIYRSTNGGKQWQRAITGFADLSAVTVAFASVTTDASTTAFASSEAGRLYRSADGGVTWAEVPSWAGLGLVTAITVSPDYARDQTIFVATPRGVYRTLDDGQSWEEASFGLLDMDILFLACAPDFAETGVLWAGTALGGFYRSRNGGLAWRESGTGLPDAAIQCLAIAPNFAETPLLFVGTENDGVYRSHDKGLQWEQAGSALAGSSVNALAISRHEDSYTLVAGTNAGLSYSTDGGDNWQTADNGALLALDLATTTHGMVLAGTFQEALALSVDGGHSWQPAGDELATHTPPLIVHTDQGTIYALDAEGTLAVSHDVGTNWELEPANDEMVATVASVGGRVDESTGLYLATDQSLLYRITGPDAVWTELTLPTADVTHLAVSLVDGKDQMLLLANQTGELFFSNNGGTDWAPANRPWVGEAVLHLRFSPTYNFPEKFRTTSPAGPMGQNFSGDLYAADQSVYVITAGAKGDGNYAVKLWQSADLAEPWNALVALETAIPSVLMAQPAEGARGELFLATGHRLIKVSMDPDTNELAAQQYFFEQETRVTALALSPTFATDQTLFAATTGGLFVSTDGGQEWKYSVANPNGLPIVALWMAEPSADGALRAVTLGGEVWAKHQNRIS